jgi:predicted ATPase/DNA-binding XRE family transcriptional regulator
MPPASTGSFGDLLRQRRQAAGLTQEALAERAGLSVHGIQKLERGDTHPYRDTARRLSQALGLAAELQSAFLAAAQPAPRRRQLPPQATPHGSPQHNLPAPLSELIGREIEVAAVSARLQKARLFTLTGVGGCGKTRLALEVARQLVERYADGVWLTELAPLADPSLVAQTVAAVLDVRETPEQSIESALVGALRARRLLLVLDNCEHVLDSCAQLVDALLRECPHVQVLATSREALGLMGEAARRVPSLAVPDLRQPPAPAGLRSTPSVQLFVQRAEALQPQFSLGDTNARAVAEICVRLDGIPLALELAAARVEALTVDQVAARLDQRFRLLTGGSRTALPRQQTLRATLDWSYELLGALERCLFDRLSVFAGGWTLDAAEAVCAHDGIYPEDVLELLARLIRKSLVIAEQKYVGSARYRLLETLRQYGQERLLGATDAEAIYSRHAHYYLALAEAVPQTSWGVEQADWLERVAIERDNLRAALAWFITTNAAEQAIRLGGVLYPIWLSSGYLTDGQTQIQKVLAMSRAAAPSAACAQLLHSAACIDFYRGNYTNARRNMEQSVVLWRSVGEPFRIAQALFGLGVLAREQDDYAGASAALEEGVAIAQELHDGVGTACMLDVLGTIAHALGDYARTDPVRGQPFGCRAVGLHMGAGVVASQPGLPCSGRGGSPGRPVPRYLPWA